ncbi:MAG: Hsp33 family molecular chaperone HslO [Alphaproteobacteria bacterium]
MKSSTIPSSEIKLTATSNVDDVVQPFMIEQTGINGRFVRLGSAVNDILSKHAMAVPASRLLGEFMALAAALSSALKFDGIFTLQTSSDGPVPLVVADVTTAGHLRGHARVRDALPDAAAIAAAPVPALMGAGHLAFTVDQSAVDDRYQGIVSLQGETLADCIHHYFDQSAQFDAKVKLACARTAGGQWRAGALMIQRLPEEGGTGGVDDPDAWNRAKVLLDSARPDEMTDPNLTPNDLLFRLFHEDGVRVFEPRSLAAVCRCSRERMLNALTTLPESDLQEIVTDGFIEMTCEFCNTSRQFTPSEVADAKSDKRG